MPTVVYDHQIFDLQQYGGISRYFCELAARVHATPGFSAKVVAPLHCNDYLPHCRVPQFAVHLKTRLRGVSYLLRATNRVLGPIAVRSVAPSLIHRTYYETSPRPGQSPLVVTVFDMIHELFPDQFPVNDPVRRSKRVCVEQADHIICISESTARDLVRLLNVPRGKITVTHLGLSENFSAPAPQQEASPHDRPYLLYVGHRGGYKNFEMAISAYANSSHLKDEFDFLTFGGHPFSSGEQATIAKLPLRSGAVRRLTGSDAELARAYRHARAFVYPSKYEGFGIPPLEAMSAGCVVACSNTSSIPEVVGDAGALFDPDDQSSIGSALERLCFDEALRATLKVAGHRRVSQFSWDRCATQTLEAYKTVLGQ